MAQTSFAHVSDLHIGLDARTDRAAELLCETLLDEQPGRVLCTGDVTHRGRRVELERFREIFAPLLATGRLIVVPGNHDRLGDGVSSDLMPGHRVQAEQHGALWVVRLDSSGPHNRRWLDGHGLVTAQDIGDVEHALKEAPSGLQRLLMLHHHPLPLPDDSLIERAVGILGLACSQELKTGAGLLDRIRGHCDVLLHGHRHVPAELSPWPGDHRPLRIFSAGSSTQQRRFRLFRSATAAACWIPLRPPPALAAEPMPA